jgi:hypothetical protein
LHGVAYPPAQSRRAPGAQRGQGGTTIALRGLTLAALTGIALAQVFPYIWMAATCLAGYAFAKVRFCGRDACFLLVIARLLVPPQVRFARFSAVYHWNDFFWPLVMNTADAVRTLLVGVAMLLEEGTGARWLIIRAFTLTSLK